MLRESLKHRHGSSPLARAAAAPGLFALALLVAPSPSSPSSPTERQEGGAQVAARACPEEWLCEREYFRADVVFVGRVTRVTRRARRRGTLVSFAVERRYLGLNNKETEVEVRAGGLAGAPAADFKVGESYLVHADASYSLKQLDLSTLTVSTKTPPRLAADAREEIACMEERRARPTASRGPHPYVLSGRAISRPTPPYPPEAKAARVAGTVTVLLTVDETGQVSEAEVLCGHPLLRDAARAAALRARFSPTRLSGRPVKIQTAVAYTFLLDD